MSLSPWKSAVRFVLLSWLVAVLWLIAAPCRAQQENVSVQLHENVSDGIVRSTYRLVAAPVHAELIVDRDSRIGPKPELRFTAWRGDKESFREDSSIPLDQRLAYFRTLMQRFLATEPGDSSYGLLFYGYSELNQRLPVLAAQDSGWDSHAGRPKSGVDSYRYLQELLNKSDAYRELAAAANALHLQARIQGGMENLRVLPVSMLSSDQKKNLPKTLRHSDLLPARVSIDFLLTPQ